MAELHDDGTMDTVIACPECGKEARYTYDGGSGNDELDYDAFVKWAMGDFDEDHECESEE